MAIAYYGARISPHMTRTPEGYLICHDVPINRTGDQISIHAPRAGCDEYSGL